LNVFWARKHLSLQTGKFTGKTRLHRRSNLIPNCGNILESQGNPTPRGALRPTRNREFAPGEQGMGSP
jgi:hypothetical protein